MSKDIRVAMQQNIFFCLDVPDQIERLFLFFISKESQTVVHNVSVE